MENKTHWKKLHNPDYLGAYALVPGQDLIATLDYVKNEIVTGPDGRKEECTVAHFKERGIKPMIMNATNCKTVQKIYRTPYIEEWNGRKIQIYIDNNIKLGKEIVEGLRIRPFIPKQTETSKPSEPKFCADCGQEIKPFGKMDAVKMASYTYDKYGKELCADCAKIEADKAEKAKVDDPLAENKAIVEGEANNEDNQN